MNKQEALQIINELEKKTNELKQFVEQCDKKKERILVPKEIVFEGYKDIFGLVFDTNRVLFYAKSVAFGKPGWRVTGHYEKDALKHGDLELVKVEPSELKVGEWYFVGYGVDGFNYSSKRSYSLYVGNSTFKQVHFEVNIDTITANDLHKFSFFHVRRVVLDDGG
jgi:hypothetical protein